MTFFTLTPFPISFSCFTDRKKFIKVNGDDPKYSHNSGLTVRLPDDMHAHILVDMEHLDWDDMPEIHGTCTHEAVHAAQLLKRLGVEDEETYAYTIEYISKMMFAACIDYLVKQDKRKEKILQTSKNK